MTHDAVDIVRQALIEALIIAAPILGAGLLVGLLISLFQAVTQIQEQTLTFVPKIVIMIIVSVALLSWIAVRMTEFAMEMFAVGAS
ncbi:MAG: flagellar biosynthetic protein FliQ [Planctomycetota bacterium]|jgi:flagellar biosynthetic protein FliQ